MKQHYSSLCSTYSKKYSCSMQSILDSSKVITISVGIYFYKQPTAHKKLETLPYIFTREISSIVSSDPKAFCIHNGYTLVIYLYSEYDEKNYEIFNKIFIYLSELQNSLKTIRLCTGVDRRSVQGYRDIILSELMAYTRMLKHIYNTVNQEYLNMDKGISFINEMKMALEDAIENSNYDLSSQDIIEISQHLDTLINSYMHNANIIAE